MVVGSGPEFDHLQFLAETLIPGRYCFAGNVPRVVPYYELADVVVCPRAFSRGEISRAIPEACAAGKPMIVPKIGGWNEYVDDSRGFPVVADDEIDYAEALLHCLENPGANGKGDSISAFCGTILKLGEAKGNLHLFVLTKATETLICKPTPL